MDTGNWSEHLARRSSAANWWLREHPHAGLGRKGAADPPEERKGNRRRPATAMLSWVQKDPGEQVHTKTTKSPIDPKDEPAPLDQAPSTGRTTALGRRVEKPADDSVAGPSGQKDKVHHDRKHTNK